MQMFFSYLTGIGPYILAAILLGGGLAIFSPWLAKNPARWLPFALLVLCLSAIGGGETGAEGSLFRQVTWGALFAYSGLWLFFTTKNWSKLYQSVPGLLLLLLALAGLSVFWSPLPMVSLKRYAQLVGVLLIGLVLARQVAHGRNLHEVLFLPCAAFLVFGLAFAALQPGIGFDIDHALKAFSSHKNTWGQFSLLCCLVFSIAMVTLTRLRWVTFLFFILAVASLVTAKSTTSLLAFAVMASLTLVWLAIYRGGTLGLLGLLMIVVASALGTHVYLLIQGEFPFERIIESVYAAAGKNTTLSGRTYLWELVLTEISRHPTLGIGYGGFWVGLDGPSRAIIARLDWGPPSQAHSGYLDVTNELGFLGVALLMLMLLVHLRNVWQLNRWGFREQALFHGGLLFCALIINYAETSFLRTTHLWWILLCASMVDVQARLWRYRTSAVEAVQKPHLVEVPA